MIVYKYRWIPRKLKLRVKLAIKRVLSLTHLINKAIKNQLQDWV